MAFLGATGRCSGCTVLIFECVDGVSRGYWQMFQVYMLIIILILPTIIMTFAYSSISIEVIRFNHKIATIQGMQIKALQLNPIYMTHRTLLALCIKRCEIKNIEHGFLSCTRPSGLLAACLGRRDDAVCYCLQGGATPPDASPVAQSGA